MSQRLSVHEALALRAQYAQQLRASAHLHETLLEFATPDEQRRVLALAEQAMQIARQHRVLSEAIRRSNLETFIVVDLEGV